jgi:hypothetical protein
VLIYFLSGPFLGSSRTPPAVPSLRSTGRRSLIVGRFGYLLLQKSEKLGHIPESHHFSGLRIFERSSPLASRGNGLLP